MTSRHTSPEKDARAVPEGLASPIYANTLGDPQFATTLARGLEILRCFTPQAPTLGNKDIAQRTGLPKPTISRYTYTLTQLGYLKPSDGERRYQLGTAVLSLGYPLMAAFPLRKLARPLMDALSDELGCSVSMGLRDRLNIVYIETSRSYSPAAPQHSGVGLSHPIAATSIGHAYLAACRVRERTALINEIKVKEPELHAQYASAMAGCADEVRRRGFCVNYRYIQPDIYGVAVPFGRRIDGEIVVFNCAISALGNPRHQVESRIGPRLVAMVEQLESGWNAA